MERTIGRCRVCGLACRGAHFAYVVALQDVIGRLNPSHSRHHSAAKLGIVLLAIERAGFPVEGARAYILQRTNKKMLAEAVDIASKSAPTITDGATKLVEILNNAQNRKGI